jgi:hypothetical protein
MSTDAQPSMKLQTKQREGSKVRRTYDQAQTPLQRLIASGELSAVKLQELERVTHALDPLRVLHQLEHLQKALWQHAIAPSLSNERTPPASTLPFSVQLCSEEQVPGLWYYRLCPVAAETGAETKVSKKRAAS